MVINLWIHFCICIIKEDMKAFFLALVCCGGMHAMAQTTPDTLKSARDYIIENENTRITRPPITKPDLKKVAPYDSAAAPAPVKKEKANKCCLFCNKKKKK